MKHKSVDQHNINGIKTHLLSKVWETFFRHRFFIGWTGSALPAHASNRNNPKMHSQA